MRYEFDRLERFVLAVLAYFGLSALWIYGVLDQGLLEDLGAVTWLVLALVGLAHVAFGFVCKEWIALLFPVVLVFLAVPAGYPESQFSEPAPMWFGQAVHGVFEIVLIAVGIVLRLVVEHRRVGRRAATAPRSS
jgi:hypothetical protein